MDLPGEHHVGASLADAHASVRVEDRDGIVAAQSPRADGGERGSMTNATRYLCATAHMKLGFAGTVLRSLTIDSHRAVAVSPGVDLVAVVKAALMARRRQIVRDAWLTGVISMVLVIVLAAQTTAALVAGLLVMLIAAWVIVLVERWTAYVNVAARAYSSMPTPTTFATEREPTGHVASAVAALRDSQAGNVTVHSGYAPFVGAGHEVGGWSWAVGVLKGRTENGIELAPQPFTAIELYDHVEEALAALGVQGLEVEDRLFVHGQDVRSDTRFLPAPTARPTTRVDRELMEDIMEKPSPLVRHYKWIRVCDWSGELVFSVFLGFTIRGGRLFAQANYRLLAPLDEQYHRVDRLLSDPTLSQRVRLVAETALLAPWLAVMAPLSLMQRAGDAMNREQADKATKKQIREDPMFDHGAGSSLREDAQSRQFRRYFQVLDRDMHSRLIADVLLDEIADFLDSRDIDTSDLRQRQMTILNNGLIMSGGTIQAESVAVGDRARAMAKQVAKPIAQATGKPGS